jgi:hypothetical protein
MTAPVGPLAILSYSIAVIADRALIPGDTSAILADAAGNTLNPTLMGLVWNDLATSTGYFL